MEAVIISILAEWASKTNPTSFAENIVLFLIAFWVVKRWSLDKMITEMAGVKNEVKEVKNELKEVKTAIVRVESEHLKEIDQVKHRVTILESKTIKGEL